jgi:zinc protease
VPSVGSAKVEWEPYALRLLGAVLSEGNASRLDQVLRYDKKQVLSIGVSYDLLARLDTDFSIYMTPKHGVDEAALMVHVRHLIDEVAKRGVSTEALSRARAQVMASHVFAQDSWEGRAQLMGRLAILGKGAQDYKAFEGRIEAVTSEQIQTVAKNYFSADRWVSLALQPVEKT